MGHAAVLSTGASPLASGKPVIVKDPAHVASAGVKHLKAKNYWPTAASSGGSSSANPGCSSSSACPMGVADYGLTGSLTTYSYNTTDVEGFADIAALNIKSGGTACLDSSASLCMGFQLNWIDNNVVVHAKKGQYWSQDVAQVAYDKSCSSPCVSGTYSVTWLSNLWNFSTSSICPNGKGLGCMNKGDVTGNLAGACSSSGTGSYYYCVGPTVYDLKMPFTIWTFMSTGPSNTVYGPCASVTHDSCVDFYGGIIKSNAYVFGSYFDGVQFSSGSGGGGHPSFLVKDACAPYCLPYDGEWVACGPASGQHATLSSGAQVSLEEYYYSTSSGSFVTIRHAWSSGDDTAEALTNANIFDYYGDRDTGSLATGSSLTLDPGVNLW